MEITRPPRPKTLLEKLTAYQPIFSDYHTRYDRSLVTVNGKTVGGDPALNSEWTVVERHMNNLLEQYFAQITNTAFVGVIEGVEIPIKVAHSSIDIPVKHETPEEYRQRLINYGYEDYDDA